jgi:hypothetical protein
VTCVWGARGGAGSLVAPSGRLHLVDHETDANEASHVKEKDSQRQLSCHGTTAPSDAQAGLSHCELLRPNHSHSNEFWNSGRTNRAPGLVDEICALVPRRPSVHRTSRD